MDFWKKYSWVGYVLVVLITLSAAVISVTHSPQEQEIDVGTETSSTESVSEPATSTPAESSQYHLN